MFLFKSAGVLTVLTLAVGIVTAQDSTPRYRTFISDTTLPASTRACGTKTHPGRRAQIRLTSSPAPAERRIFAAASR
jgi:hypothetical protein